MTDTVDTPDPGDARDAGALARRHLIRGTAVLAGAAGLSAVGAALAPRAEAATGGNAILGQVNEANVTTTIRSTVQAQPTLTLDNAVDNGPVLALTPRPTFGDTETPPTLKVGEILNTPTGPYLGVSDSVGGTPVTGYLATNFDLDNLPVSVAITPQRILDTRYAASRVYARAYNDLNPFDSAGRLKQGFWIDVAVDAVNDEYVADAAYLNLTATGPVNGGYLTAYPPGTRPNVSSLNFGRGATIANFAFVKLGLYAGEYVVRIYTSQTTHVILDLTGEATLGPSAAEPSPAARKAARVRPARRVFRTPRRR